MNGAQPGILLPPPLYAAHLFFALDQVEALREALGDLQQIADGVEIVVGIGGSVVSALGAEIPGLRAYPAQTARGLDLPSTPSALWVWVRGEDRSAVHVGVRAVKAAVEPAFSVACAVDAFLYAQGRDLTGYEDGTENPTGAQALQVAIVAGDGALMGSSFAVVQQWVHDLDTFEAMPTERQNEVFGRDKLSNVEISSAPKAAHVRRTAQESFDPPAFLLRRSMSWSDHVRSGLVFLSFSASLDPFEAMFERMVGAEDAIQDALFQFTRPITGAYFWCPPFRQQLDFSAIGLGTTAATP